MHDHLVLDVAAGSRSRLVQLHATQLARELLREAEQCSGREIAGVAIEHVDTASPCAKHVPARRKHPLGQLTRVDGAGGGCGDFTEDSGTSELDLLGFEQSGPLGCHCSLSRESFDQRDLALVKPSPFRRLVDAEKPQDSALVHQRGDEADPCIHLVPGAALPIVQSLDVEGRGLPRHKNLA